MAERIIKTFVEGTWHDNAHLEWINVLLEKEGIKLVSLLKGESPDLIIFTGGEDINPSMYGEPVGMYTAYLPKRDSFCNKLWNYAIENEVPTIGICRGAQFLCVKNSGSLIQHVNGHGSYHMIKAQNGEQMYMSSTHHQMMNPFTAPLGSYQILAYTAPRISNTYLNGWNKPVDPPQVEPEVVFFRYTKSLAIQGHPEYMDIGKYTAPKWIAERINELILTT